MRLKHYLVALLFLYGLPQLIAQQISVVIAQDNAEDEYYIEEQTNLVDFECDDNKLPEGLCGELKENFASGEKWKQANQEALTCITDWCRPGIPSPFTKCEEVGFGQRCAGVEISSDDPQVWSSEIKSEPEYGLSPEEHQKHLVVRALGFSKMVSYLAKEAIHNSNKDFDEAKSVYDDENLTRQIEEAKHQESYYDNINFREVSQEAVCNDPHYNGDVKRYLYDEFNMDDRYLTAINVAGNGFGQILDGKDDPEKVFSRGAINNDGRLRSGKICRGKEKSFTLPSDELLETVSTQTESMKTRGLINEVGKVTRDGKKALRLANKYEDNLAVQCKIKESQMENILGAVSSNNRFMNASSQSAYCSDLGKGGCSLPETFSSNPSCQTSYADSLDQYLTEYMESDEFEKEKFIDPTTGRLKTDVKELLKDQLDSEKIKQFEEAQSKHEDLQKAIEIRARFSAIMSLLEAEIGNNKWFFKPGQKIMTDGGREIKMGDLGTIDDLDVVGDIVIDLPSNISSPGNSFSEMSSSGFSEESNQGANFSGGVDMQTHFVNLPSHSSSSVDFDEYDGIDVGANPSNSGFGLLGSKKKSANDPVENNPIYTNKSDRNNLIHFPDEIIHSGALSKYRTGSGFCTPSKIAPAENDDPNCRCVKGPLLRVPMSDSLDQVFEPCPGEEGYITEF